MLGSIFRGYLACLVVKLFGVQCGLEHKTLWSDGRRNYATIGKLCSVRPYWNMDMIWEYQVKYHIYRYHINLTTSLAKTED